MEELAQKLFKSSLTNQRLEPNNKDQQGRKNDTPGVKMNLVDNFRELSLNHILTIQERIIELDISLEEAVGRGDTLAAINYGKELRTLRVL